MPSLADLLAGRESFDDIRRMGPQRSWAESQQELATQARSDAAAQPNYGMTQSAGQSSLMDILKRLMPNAGPVALPQARPNPLRALLEGVMGAPVSPPPQPSSNGFMGVRG